MSNVPIKIALVTGSTSGIGKAIALALAKQGMCVIINGRRDRSLITNLLSTIEEINNIKPCPYIQGDIATEQTRNNIIEFIKNNYGYLNILVNNAGITTQSRKDMVTLTEDDMLYVLKVNCIAPFLLTTALYPILVTKNSINYIINIASISSYTVSTNRADYCISKAGMSMMTKLFAIRFAADNIRVFELRPGIIQTDMTRPVQEKYDNLIANGLLPISRWGQPEDVAMVVDAITKGFYNYSTGEVIHIDGGFHITQL